MAKVIPFKGILYDPDKVRTSSVMAPPYDIVTPAMKETLYSSSSHNIIRIDFGKDKDGDNKEENRYTRASKFLSDWLSEGILMHDSEPFFYCYEISYEINGQKKKTKGFLGAVKIEELATGMIHPHEMTYSKPKSDRLNILRYCGANISPIFSLYSSEKKLASSVLENVVKENALIEAQNGDGFIHRLWRITEKDSIEKIIKEMSDKDIFIADGHHRYETALSFRKEMGDKGMSRTGDEPFHYVLMYLSNTEDEGLTLLPTHRMVEIDSDINTKDVLRKYFDIQKISSEGLSEEKARQHMFEKMYHAPLSLGLFLTNSNTYYVLTFNNTHITPDLPEPLKKLEVTILHKFIFQELLKVKHFEYEMDPYIAVERARKGSFEAVFFLNPTKIKNVKEVALSGQRMPPKSTYFFPKLQTGMVIYKF
jgi:uncharacterized protein (DUF1015 family)